MELKQLIKQQKAKGVLVKTLAHPSLVIMAQDCGMDFILNDCEHGVLSYEQLHDLMCLAICESFHRSSELHSWPDRMYPESWIAVPAV